MQPQNYSIKSWAPDDRPREKLLSKNTSSLTDSEILAILIGKGTKEKNAVILAQELLGSVKNNLNELGRLEIHDFLKLNGIGRVKPVIILATLEPGRKRHIPGALEKPVVRDRKQVAGYLKATLQDPCREGFAVIFLNHAN